MREIKVGNCKTDYGSNQCNEYGEDPNSDMVLTIYDDKNSNDMQNAANIVKSSLLSYDSPCRGSVSSKYISSAVKKMENFDLIIIQTCNRTVQSRRGEKIDKGVVGFTICKFENDDEGNDYLYIDIICSKAVGLPLLLQAIKYSEENNFEYTKLSALTHVIGYYKKMAFKFAEKRNCEDKDLANAYNNLAIPFITDYIQKTKEYVAICRACKRSGDSKCKKSPIYKEATNFLSLNDADRFEKMLNENTKNADAFKKFIEEYVIANKFTRIDCNNMEVCGTEGYTMIKNNKTCISS